MSQLQTEDITQAVLDRLAPEADPRFVQIISAVVRHAHALAREVDLKPDEWMAAIQFLTQTGKTCDDKRQEFILLSDTLGLSMLVVQLEQARRSAAALTGSAAAVEAKPTEATVQGPFYWQGSPVLPLGSDIGQGAPGEPAHYSGRVTDTSGKPVANCCMDVWSGDGDGFYDMQLGDAMRLRARFHTDADGRYHFWSIKPTFYPVPDDGPVGAMLRAMGRHPNRPGHIHMMVYGDGYVPLTTHLFAADSPFLDSDAVFGVRDSLVVHYEKHAPGTAPDGRVMTQPFHSTSYDFRLAPTAHTSA